jgi:hypothetical protein
LSLSPERPRVSYSRRTKPQSRPRPAPPPVGIFMKLCNVAKPLLTPARTLSPLGLNTSRRAMPCSSLNPYARGGRAGRKMKKKMKKEDGTTSASWALHKLPAKRHLPVSAFSPKEHRCNEDVTPGRRKSRRGQSPPREGTVDGRCCVARRTEIFHQNRSRATGREKCRSVRSTRFSTPVSGGRAAVEPRREHVASDWKWQSGWCSTRNLTRLCRKIC